MSKDRIAMSRDEQTPITDMSAKQAKAYFRKPESYVNFSLPPYVSFNEVLKVSSEIVKGKEIRDICIGEDEINNAGKENNQGTKSNSEKSRPAYPSRFPDVNCTILSNKNGNFAWRPLQIIHPVLYCELVNYITQDKNWKELQKFFQQRGKSKVDCISIPLESNTSESDQARQVTNWWNEVEQATLRQVLDYNFMHQTDISDCYGSIYTHSFEWTLAEGGRLAVKKQREKKGESKPNLGTGIDVRLQNMNQGQTNGISQGSTLMDFLAEIVLGGVDIELTDRIENDDKLKDKDNKSFKIIRYRDDYRILSDESCVGHQIMKLLSDVLMNWNFKMNSGKTFHTSDIVSSAIKEEKREEIYMAPRQLSYQKDAMRIFLLSKKYPSAGLIAKQLTDYFDRINKEEALNDIDYEVVISIIAMIAYHSPRYIAHVAAIVTLLIEKSNNVVDRAKTVDRIAKKFDSLPNTEFIDIWLQRIMDGNAAITHTFNSKITEVIAGKKKAGVLWNSFWLPYEGKKMLDIEISTLQKEVDSEKHSPIIKREEVQLYNY